MHPLTGRKRTPGAELKRRAGYVLTMDGPKEPGVLSAPALDGRNLPEIPGPFPDPPLERFQTASAPRRGDV